MPSGFDSVVEANAGTVQDIIYDSTAIKANEIVTRRAKVVLPKGYTTSKTYPVVYMLHGIFCNETTLYNDNTQYVMWNAIASGAAEEMILVFPNACANETGESVEVNGSGFNLEHYHAYDNFINDLRDCLMPYVISHYSVKTGRENTAICGFSMGGRTALYIGFAMQDTFRYIGGFCPTFGIFEYSNYGVHEDGLFTESTFMINDEFKDDTLIIIAAGTEDYTVGSEPKRYADALTANNVTHLYYELEGEGHGSEVYKHGLYQLLRRAFK